MAVETLSAEQESRLVCAILAEQVADLRERIAASVMFDRLVSCAELLGTLSSQLPQGGDSAAIAVRLDRALDDLTFHHAQHQDLARQTADLVAHALKLLAAGNVDPLHTLSLNGLLALYVSDDQRRLHEAVLADHARSHATDDGGAEPKK